MRQCCNEARLQGGLYGKPDLWAVRQINQENKKNGVKNNMTIIKLGNKII